MTGCANFYVDPATKDVPVAEMRKPATPKPVQLVFEFQNQGAPVARATEFLQGAVKAQVEQSGLFASVQTEPSADAPILNVVLNNIPIDMNTNKAFLTGLTFGAAGSTAIDGYVCTVSYLAAGQSQPIVKTARNAIHTTLGSARAPAGMRKAESLEQAVRQMSHAVISNALRDLSLDSGFGN
ncbi:hypothetical protein ACPRNU_08330 [Chromobacterium vaccinii]|uniref:hypothetical protein n=1 Tax=Chromobacterium vaccinii TaxID=1108595 RepID=UPI003C77F7AE